VFRHLRFLAPIAILVTALIPGVAQAAPPYEHVKYSGTDSFTTTDCGLDVSVDVAFNGVLHIRTVKDSDGQAFLAHNNYDTTETITNPANGQQLIIRANGVFHEQRATHIEGDIWAFEFLDAGTFTLSDLDGNVLLRDRGVVKVRQVFDTLGDSQPGGEILSEELLSIAGPHATEDTFCQTYLAQLT